MSASGVGCSFARRLPVFFLAVCTLTPAISESGLAKYTYSIAAIATEVSSVYFSSLIPLSSIITNSPAPTLHTNSAPTTSIAHVSLAAT